MSCCDQPGLIPVEQALEKLLNAAQPITETEMVAVGKALGRVLAADQQSTVDVPPADNSAMDGFAFNSVDCKESGQTTLPLSQRIPAGVAPQSLQPGTAARIFTGAEVPSGADTVIMQENCQWDSDQVILPAEPKAGDNVRPRGQDIQSGSIIMCRGHRIKPQDMGLLASVGIAEVPVYRRLKVAVLSTGDELVDDGRPLLPGEIRDSNRRTLLTLAAEAGWDAVDLGIAVDEPGAIREAFLAAAESCDAILSSGGVSMGAFDYVKVVLDEIGDMRWMQIAIKPAKPFAFGLVGATPVFGLPGNPVSSMVSFELLARPAIGFMAGMDDTGLVLLRAISEDTLDHPADGKVHFLRVEGRIDDTGRWHVRRAGGQGSHQLTAMARADALALVPDGVNITPGDEVQILPLR